MEVSLRLTNIKILRSAQDNSTMLTKCNRKGTKVSKCQKRSLILLTLLDEKQKFPLESKYLFMKGSSHEMSFSDYDKIFQPHYDEIHPEYEKGGKKYG